VERRIRRRFPSPTRFARNLLPYDYLLAIYDTIAREYPGWGLEEIRGMSSRERINWLSLIKWRRSFHG
jgi:hypothetical protein